MHERTTPARLDKALHILRSEAFANRRGISNELGFFVFDCPP